MSKDINLHVRLTAEENALLTSLSTATKCSKSQVLRDLLHGAKLIEAPPVAYYDLLREVRRVGVNLNQLARYVNEKRFIDSWKWDEALADIRAIEKTRNDAVTPRHGAVK